MTHSKRNKLMYVGWILILVVALTLVLLGIWNGSGPLSDHLYQTAVAIVIGFILATIPAWD